MNIKKSTTKEWFQIIVGILNINHKENPPFLNHLKLCGNRIQQKQNKAMIYRQYLLILNGDIAKDTFFQYFNIRIYNIYIFLLQQLKIEQFKQFNLTDSQMHNGMLFIWCEKDNIMEIIDQLEKLGFNYVENFTTVLLSMEKILTITPSEPQVRKITEFFSKKNIKQQKEIKKIDGLRNQEQLPDLDPTQVFWNENYTYFRKTKRTLLMFRKQSKQQLELRHQRTGDIFFDVIEKDSQNISAIGMEYIYKMIETLLPKALYKTGDSLKMMELFADSSTQGRSGWIQVIQD